MNYLDRALEAYESGHGGSFVAECLEAGAKDIEDNRLFLEELLSILESGDGPADGSKAVAIIMLQQKVDKYI